MAITQQYAYLSERVYDEPNINKTYDNVGAKREYTTPDGQTYRILAHASNPVTGYQGTVYQAKNGEIIISHRGTESPKADPMDTKADLAMGRSHTNPQVKDALALTEMAMKLAKKQQQDFNLVTPPSVTVTGHSLGGALAEITAHKYGLYGEAFNGYGAASLNYGVPRGGSGFTNHVMAGDAVSAASPHYGKVIIYASQNDVTHIRQYEQNRSQSFATGNTVKALIGEDHTITNFTGSNRPNILKDPQALARAQQNATAIAHFREDVQKARIQLGINYLNPSSIIKAYQETRDNANENRRQINNDPFQQMQQNYQRHNQNLNIGAGFGGFRSDASDHLPDAIKPLHASVNQKIQKLYEDKGIPFSNGGENTIMACTQSAAKHGLSNVDLCTVHNGQIVMAQSNGIGLLSASVPATPAANTPVEQSINQINQDFQQQLLQQQTLAQNQSQGRSIS